MDRADRSDIKNYPYWHDQIVGRAETAQVLPKRVDVLVVGSGYTGLSAAIQTARGGRETLVLDSGEPGFGCSTRNGGQVSTSVKPSLAKLTKRFGAQKARAIRQEGNNALDWLAGFIAREGLDCDFRRSGRFHAAHTPRHYEELLRDAAQMAQEEGIESHAVPRSEQRKELGTDAYFGGVVFPKHASVHPAKLHREMMTLALDAGAQIVGNCAVTRITRSGTGFLVETEGSPVEAGDVIVATNGYSDGLVPWLKRRIIPIGSYIIATEELPQKVIDVLFPTDRIASDTFKVLYYYRASPDRKRVLFGGRVSARETDASASVPLLYRYMCRIFPELEAYGISHSWSGTVAYSFDELAHCGLYDGVHYAVGYCGSGVSMASYLGMRTGQKVLGLQEGTTAFDTIPHPTRPLYTGTPWFLPTVVSYYRWRDQRQHRTASSAGQKTGSPG